jgi:uncharacterized membrane protein (UPF0127 family)
MISLACGGALVGGRIQVASTFGRRFLGLMFRKSLPEGSGLLLAPCGSIHMCFMRMPLDIAYLGADYRVLAVQKGLRPWRVGAAVKGAKMVLELPVGTLARCGISPGDMLEATSAAEEFEEKRKNDGCQRAGKRIES